MAKRKENEILYKTFREFLDLCIVKDQSLLWPEKRCWTIDNLVDIKTRMIDNPIWGDELSFEEKLIKQMEGASEELWAVICDMYFVYFMPSTFMKFQKKRNDILKAAELGDIKPPPIDAEIWDAQKHGFTRTAMKYHYKYGQFWLIILFALAVKQNEEPESVVAKPQIMQQTLDMCLESFESKVDRAYDMRHAMLYMAFPNDYERIISTRDKRRIYEKYRDLIDAPVPADLDERIRLIRKALSSKYDKSDREFDFYTDLKSKWRPKTSTSKDTVTVKTEKGPITVPPSDDPSKSSTESSKEVSEHTEIQWLLLKLGSDMGLDVWVAKNDKNKEVNGQKFCDLPKLKRELPLKFDEVTNKTIELIDVLWIKGNAILAAFEIESTTSIYSGLLRMADLIAMQPNLNIPLYLVAPDERRSKVLDEINRPVFSRLSPAMKDICKYISFSALRKEVSNIASMIKYMKPDFLDEFAESCEPEDDE